MLRMIVEIVCPCVLLLGEVVMEPDKVMPYFGSVSHPECHLLYNVTTMASIWHTVATGDTTLLKRQLEQSAQLPQGAVYQNYLRCHDDIGWGLDYAFLAQYGMQEVPHKKYLNDFLTGKLVHSFARGDLYNDDPELGDARLCGTTAALCGLERAIEEKDELAIELALNYDLCLHALIFSLSGIPVLYSGDEIGQLNDPSYLEDSEKRADSRYLHRGAFSWMDAALIDQKGSVQARLFEGLSELVKLRFSHELFAADVLIKTLDTGDASVLAFVRRREKERLFCLFNFSPFVKTLSLSNEQAEHSAGADYVDLRTQEKLNFNQLSVAPFSFRWIYQKFDEDN